MWLRGCSSAARVRLGRGARKGCGGDIWSGYRVWGVAVGFVSCRPGAWSSAGVRVAPKVGGCVLCIPVLGGQFWGGSGPVGVALSLLVRWSLFACSRLSGVVVICRLVWPPRWMTAKNQTPSQLYNAW